MSHSPFNTVTEAPVKAPTKAPEAPDTHPGPERYYSPRKLCPDQRKDGAWRSQPGM